MFKASFPLLLLVALLAPPAPAGAQESASLFGLVSDPAGDPVDGAVLTLLPAGGEVQARSVLTDARGAYQLVGLRPGSYMLRVDRLGYAVTGEGRRLTLAAGSGVFGVFDLDSDLLLAIREGFPEGTYLEVVVSAADRNYANALRGGGFNPSGEVRISSVVGDGVGYFGSLAPLPLSIVVTADEGAQPPCAPAV